MMDKQNFVLFALSILIVSAFAYSGFPLLHAPRIKHLLEHGTSLNWAGYAVETNLNSPQSGAVTDVKGSWKVPAVNCKSAPNAYSSFWIGIDGYSSSTVEQIGTDSDCSSKKPRYYAWFEMYPAYPVNLNMKISPGDVMIAEVQYIGNNQFTLTITDTTTSSAFPTGQTFTITQSLANAQRSSAEWIAEAPSIGASITNLANFGTVYFTSSKATLNGHPGTISDSAWQKDGITMVATNGAIKAKPSVLSTYESAFSVSWYHK